PQPLRRRFHRQPEDELHRGRRGGAARRGRRRHPARAYRRLHHGRAVARNHRRLRTPRLRHVLPCERHGAGRGHHRAGGRRGRPAPRRCGLADARGGQDPSLRQVRTEVRMKRLDGKTALITGAARGIGLALARAYVAEGARVAIADINVGAAEQAAGEIGPAAVAVRMDVTEQSSIETAVAEAESALSGIDILINNAALFTAAPIVEIARTDYDRIFAVNVAGTLFTLQAVARRMIARGRGGKIINMASQAGRRGEALVAVYCA